MNRRDFLKRAGGLLGVALVSQFTFLDKVAVKSYDYTSFTVGDMAEIDIFSEKYIKIAMQKLADSVDNQIVNTFFKVEHNE